MLWLLLFVLSFFSSPCECKLKQRWVREALGHIGNGLSSIRFSLNILCLLPFGLQLFLGMPPRHSWHVWWKCRPTQKPKTIALSTLSLLGFLSLRDPETVFLLVPTFLSFLSLSAQALSSLSALAGFSVLSAWSYARFARGLFVNLRGRLSYHIAHSLTQSLRKSLCDASASQVLTE